MATPLQELEIRAADIRRRFGEIGAMSGDDLTDEITAELAGLRAEHATNEMRQTALKLSGDVAPTPVESGATDGVEYRNLLRRANVGEIFHVALHGGVTHGATAELQQAHNLDVRQVPLAMLIQDMDGLETRAAVAMRRQTCKAIRRASWVTFSRSRRVRGWALICRRLPLARQFTRS